MAEKTNDINFSASSDEPDNINEYEDNYSETSSQKKDLSARRKLDELMEEKRLSKILKDEFDDWN